MIILIIILMDKEKPISLHLNALLADLIGFSTPPLVLPLAFDTDDTAG